jgi:hypothetical protein
MITESHFNKKSMRMVCTSAGDPHFQTFSGKIHHAMGKGEYILTHANSSSVDTFSVHACHSPVGGDGTTSGVAVTIGIAIRSAWGTVKLLDGGAPVFSGMTPGAADIGIGITKTGNRYRLTFPDGQVVQTGHTETWRVPFYSTTIILPTGYCGGVKGLCGAFDPPSLSANTLKVNCESTAASDAGYCTVDMDYTDIFSGSSHTRWGGEYLGQFQTHFADSWKVAGASADAIFTAEECPSGASPLASQTVEEVVGTPCAECSELEVQAELECPAGAFHDFCVADVCATCELATWVNVTKEAHEEMLVATDPAHDDTPDRPGMFSPPTNPTPAQTQTDYDSQISSSCPMTAIGACVDFDKGWVGRVQANRTTGNFLSADVRSVIGTVDGGKWATSLSTLGTSGWAQYYWDTDSGETQWDGIPASLAAAAAAVAAEGGPCMAAISCCQSCFKCGEELTSQMVIDGDAKFVCNEKSQECGYFKGVYECKCREAALSVCRTACASQPALLLACDHCSRLMGSLPRWNLVGN